MDRVHIYPFALRIRKFTDLGRESYVGSRVYPRLALLYAATMLYPDPAHHEFAREYIEEYVEDTYFDLYVNTRGGYDQSLEVPDAVRSKAFVEIIRGAELIRDIAGDIGEDIIENIHRYRAVVDALGNSFVVVRRDHESR